MKEINVKIRITRQGAILPEYATAGSAGMDLCAHLQDGAVTLAPMERRLIPTGLSIELPEGYEAQVRPRSGMALKQGLTVVNSPGTIDSDYRGEIGVILINLGQLPIVIEDKQRIAQMVVAPYSRVVWHQTDSLDATERGEGGFGHTGINA